MRTIVLAGVLASLSCAVHAQGMDKDPEARALRARFQASQVAATALSDNWDDQRERRLTGPVTTGPGATAGPGGRAAVFPEDRSEAIHVQYGGVVPRTGRLSLDFRLPEAMPRDHSFLTLFSVGTPGNTKLWLRVNMDRRVAVGVMTRRENLSLLSDPVTTGKWHHLEWWHGPARGVLVLDGVIHDYSTDHCVPYAVGVGEAFYLGDQPWWDPGARRGVFYPLDSFVGEIDNLEWVALVE